MRQHDNRDRAPLVTRTDRLDRNVLRILVGEGRRIAIKSSRR